ncbi:hypothetical protein [Leucobacter sp. USHLN154]|uniref:hypothetical protein n=1 Tax=Leucobacter sp. USHLN154 TaxID=3081269 RepID=UPI0030193083
MTTVEIAEHINERRLYLKRDGTPVMPSQIHGRTRNYPELFFRDGDSVYLPEWPDLPTLTTVLKAAEAVPTAPAPTSAAQEVSTATVNESWLDFSRYRPTGFVDLEIPDALDERVRHNSRDASPELWHPCVRPKQERRVSPVGLPGVPRE